MKNIKTSLALILGATILSTSIAMAQLKPITEVFSPPEPADVANYLKVAVVQWNPYQDAPVGASDDVVAAYLNSNRQTMGEKVEEAAKNNAKFIVLSEFAVVGYPDIPELPPEEDEFRNRDDIKPFIDTVPGASTAYFSNIAIKNKVWIQFGMAEVDPVTDKYYNTAVVIDDTGKIVASFRKNTLYQLENDFLSAGTDPVVFDSPVGKIGLVICADIYNYTLLEKYRKLGISTLSLSTSWAVMNSGMSTFQSAAKSLGVYVLAANQAYFPDSGVINPDGQTQSHIRQSRYATAYGFLPLVPAIPLKMPAASTGL